MKQMEDWMKKENTGSWTVLGPFHVLPNGEKKYLCRCDCGTERYVLERSLRYGGSKSCGCQKLQKAAKRREHQLAGQRFGELTVLKKSETKAANGATRWICQCSCGNTVEVVGTLLVNGRKTHCGCRTKPQYRSSDIRGQKFDRLTALYPLPQRDRKGNVIWHCRCDCGNEVDLSYNTLMYSPIRSCGCWKRERESHLSDLITRVDGTSIDMIKSKKIRADNTTGVKGVGYYRGKYFAKIVFQKKQYHLGKYDSVEAAARARREAEILLFDGAAAHYGQWKAKADADPEWGEQNPVRILVSKRPGQELDVTFLPAID